MMRREIVDSSANYYEKNSSYVVKMQGRKGRKKRKKIKGRFLRFICRCIKLGVVFMILFLGGHYLENQIHRVGLGTENIEALTKIDNLINKVTPLEKPTIGNNENDIYEALNNLAKNNSDYASIYERREEYPLELLNSLVHNDEMLEFLKGYFTSDKNFVGEITAEELSSDNPLLIQWDQRWGYTEYGDSLMGVAGCGPACLSMAVVALTNNTNATPYEVANFSFQNGYYVNGVGTSWTLISEGSEHYGLRAETLSLDQELLEKALDQDKVLILSMGPGNFTSSGHFIVLYGYNENGFFVNDPNSYIRSQKVWPFSEISDEIRNIWALSND